MENSNSNQNSKTGGKKFQEKILKQIENYSKLSDEKKNCFHIYFGYGKGKTTSAIGLAIRAIGAGKSVAIVQFDKGFDGTNEHYSERVILRKLKEIGYKIDLFPTGCERMNKDGTFRFKNNNEDYEEAKRALHISKNIMSESKYNVIILDEAIAAVAYNLLKKSDIEDLHDIFLKNRKYELIMTGHKLWDEISVRADLITEMKKIKHYFDDGIPARVGIEF